MSENLNEENEQNLENSQDLNPAGETEISEENSNLNEEIPPQSGNEQESESAKPEEEKPDEIEILQEKLENLKNEYGYAFAEWQNKKKQAEHENKEFIAFENKKFVAAFAPVWEILHRISAADFGENEMAKNMEKGVKNCAEMFAKAYEKFGFEAPKFEPNQGENDGQQG